jgi:hypothetical protein
MTSLGNVVAHVSQIVLGNANVNLITDLERDSQILDRIRDNFSRILHKQTSTVWSFVEELAISGLGRVRRPLATIYMWKNAGIADSCLPGRCGQGFGDNWRCA